MAAKFWLLSAHLCSKIVQGFPCGVATIKQRVFASQSALFGKQTALLQIPTPMMADSPPEMCPEGDLPFVDSNGSPNCSTPTVNKEKSPLSIGDDQCVAASSGASDPSVGFSNATSNQTCVNTTANC